MADITASLYTQEVGSDVVSIHGTSAIAGHISTIEPGLDTVHARAWAGFGAALAGLETGPDIGEITGTAQISGDGAALEAGADRVSATAAIIFPLSAPDSSVAGYLQGPPAGELPGQIAAGQPLEDFLQQFVAGVSGVFSNFVRPRWQAEPPNLLDFGTDWAAVGITERRPYGPYAVVRHHGDGDGYDDMQRHEEFDVLVSFYGPGASDYASNLNDGVMIPQNREALFLSGIAFVEIGASLRMPEFIKTRWVDRVDKILTFRRVIRRVYPVLHLLSAQGTAGVDDYSTPFDTDALLPN